MRILAFDPSIKCTGYAVLEGDVGTIGRVLAAGVIGTDDDNDRDTRILELMSEVDALVTDESLKGGPFDLAAIETPAVRRMAWGGFAGRSVMDAATYGTAVGAVVGCMIVRLGASRVRLAPVDLWAPPKAGGRRDVHKQSRVWLAGTDYPDRAGELGRIAKSVAGNVADAMLLGGWALRHYQQQVQP